MKISVEKIPNEPIIVLTVKGDVKSPPTFVTEAMRSAFAESKEPDYVIVDIRETTDTIDNLMALLRLIQSRAKPSLEASDFAHPPIFVGQQVVDDAQIRQTLPKFFGAKPTPVFRDKDEALAYVRSKLNSAS